MNTSFVFYTEYKDFIELLSPEDTKKLMLIIIDYVETKKEPNKPNLSDRLLMVWIGIKKRLDADKTKYDRRCETSRINGKKGGRPKNLNNQNKPKKADNDNEDDNDSDNDYVNDNNEDEEEESSSADKFYSIVEENFGYTLPSMIVIALDEWRKVFDDEIILYGVEICCKNNARTINYLEAILNNWKNKGFKKLIDCKNEKRDTQKNNRPFYEEKTPEWFGKDIEKVTASPEEIKEMQEILSKFDNEK